MFENLKHSLERRRVFRRNYWGPGVRRDRKGVTGGGKVVKDLR